MAEWTPSQGRRPQSAHLTPVPLGATGGTHRPTNLPVYSGGRVRNVKGTRRGIQPTIRPCGSPANNPAGNTPKTPGMHHAGHVTCGQFQFAAKGSIRACYCVSALPRVGPIQWAYPLDLESLRSGAHRPTRGCRRSLSGHRSNRSESTGAYNDTGPPRRRNTVTSPVRGPLMTSE